VDDCLESAGGKRLRQTAFWIRGRLPGGGERDREEPDTGLLRNDTNNKKETILAPDHHRERKEN